MEKVESIFIKLAIIQFLFLMLSQAFILYTDVAPYMTKVVQYEGVYNNELIEALETFDQMDLIMLK